jgi:hypothetical protein
VEEVAREKGELAATEGWFGDEASVAQKNKIIRRRARRCSHSSAPSDQRTASTFSSPSAPKSGQLRI